MPTLNWIGKEAVEKHHLEIPYRLLEYDNNLSVGDTDNGNLIIQGDNLHALKALMPYYSGKIKCIYIDPPYNTGNSNWQYNDNVNAPEIKSWLNNIVGNEGEDLSRHDKWLCMMYPRLHLLKKLLREDGVIFVSIDDTEQGNLRLLMDEIFGAQNFVANIVWQKKYSPQNDAKYFSDMHDFILVYAKHKNKGKEISGWIRNLLPRTAEQDSRYKNPDQDERGDWKQSDLSVKTIDPKNIYEITLPVGKVVMPPKGRCWSVSQQRFSELLNDNRIWFGKNGSSKPQLKRFRTEVQEGVVPLTIWLRDEVGDNQEGKQQLKEIFPEVNLPFETPKPWRLIKRIISIATDKDSIILDSFAGSGTTGQAVLELNKEDGGNRKFLLVEMEETICENVTKERIKRVMNGYKLQKSENSEISVEGLGGGFSYCKLGEPLFDKLGNIRSSVKFNELAYHIYFSETGTPLPDGTQFSSPLIGTYQGTAFYLLYNGILGDRSVPGGNVLTSKVLECMPPNSGKKVIFGEANKISQARLSKENIIFKQIPYEIKLS